MQTSKTTWIYSQKRHKAKTEDAAEPVIKNTEKAKRGKIRQDYETRKQDYGTKVFLPHVI